MSLHLLTQYCDFLLQAFKFKDPSEYTDSGQSLDKHFWMQDRQLRVYGGVRPTNSQAEDTSQDELMKQIATEALQK